MLMLCDAKRSYLGSCSSQTCHNNLQRIEPKGVLVASQCMVRHLTLPQTWLLPIPQAVTYKGDDYMGKSVSQHVSGNFQASSFKQIPISFKSSSGLDKVEACELNISMTCI
jgi:hypothetical protein